MPTLPGYAGRLGRLAFFGRSIVLGIGAMVCLFVPLLGMSAGGESGLALIAMLLVMPVTLYIGLGLQVRRIRDIGWSPALVIIAWFGVMILDALVAHLFPATAGGRHGTPLGGLVNLGFSLVLMFWPGRPDDDDDRPWEAQPLPTQRYVPTTRQRPLPGEAMPAGQAAITVARPGGFGRRLA